MTKAKLFWCVERVAAFGMALLLAVPCVVAQIDRNPELKSRALAWTEFDGSYLVDTQNRGEMLNFYWNVFARPYPATNWTGSTNPPVPGETSELWRIREIAQINAYRAMNYSPAIGEFTERLPIVQEGAMVSALNPTKSGHIIDESWVGYSATAAFSFAHSNLGTYAEWPNRPALRGMADAFIHDAGSSNAPRVGHRTSLLRHSVTHIASGAAYSTASNGFRAHFSTRADQLAPMSGGQFVSWPASGFMPLALFRSRGDVAAYRWSFTLADSYAESERYASATISAKLNGVALPIHNLSNNVGSSLTWEFAPANFNFETANDGDAIEITITNVKAHGQTYNYRYTVTLFDETVVKPAAFSPKTPLVNISTRGRIGAGGEVMIGGFIVEGTTPVRVALRAQGPSLAQFGLPKVAGKTRIELFQGSTKIGENAGWKSHPDWRLLQSFQVAPSSDNEAGMIATLWPGSYTAIVRDDTNVGGVGIIEGFNVDSLTEAKLKNVSTRGYVGNDQEQLIAGFIVGGSTSRTVVIRTQGPGLAQFGVTNAVSDTRVTVVRQSDSVTIAENDDWQSDSRNARLQTDLSSYRPGDSREAALVLTLPPGAYTVLVAPKGPAGIGIVEVFEVE